MKRALQCFHLNPDEWGVNVQSYSGVFLAITLVYSPTPNKTNKTKNKYY
jgi:hypothetical protein